MAQPEQPNPGYQEQPRQPQTEYGLAPTVAPDGLRKNPLGLSSLIVGAAIPVLGLIGSLVSAVTGASGNYQALQFVGAAQGVLALLLGLTALGLGIAGLLRRNSRRAAAGAGTALGAVAVFGLLNGLVYALAYGAS